MVTLSMPTADMVRELLDDQKRAKYWFKKHWHGDKGYDKLQNDLLRKAYDRGKNQFSEIVEYISPKGNRWMMFEAARFYPKANRARTMPVFFCYYETYGSVGAFMIGYDQMDMNCERPTIVIFTSHFFLRFCQRLKVEMRSRWMVQKFCEAIPGYLIYPYNDKKSNGLVPIDIRLPGSLGRGFARTNFENGTIIEIRTFLTDPELSPKQMRETEEVRRLGDSMEYEPFEIWIHRLAKLRGDDLLNEWCKKLNFVEKQGVPRDFIHFSIMFSSFGVDYAIEHDLMDATEAADFGNKMANSFAIHIVEYIEKKIDWGKLCAKYFAWLKKTFKGIDLHDAMHEFAEYCKKITDLNKEENDN